MRALVVGNHTLAMVYDLVSRGVSYSKANSRATVRFATACLTACTCTARSR